MTRTFRKRTRLQATPIVYVLDLPDAYYVGMTEFWPKRLKAHKAGQCATSKELGAENYCEQLHYWNCASREEALRLERYIHLNIEDLITFVAKWPSDSGAWRALVNEDVPPYKPIRNIPPWELPPYLSKNLHKANISFSRQSSIF